MLLQPNILLMPYVVMREAQNLQRDVCPGRGALGYASTLSILGLPWTPTTIRMTCAA